MDDSHDIKEKLADLHRKARRNPLWIAAAALVLFAALAGLHYLTH